MKKILIFLLAIIILGGLGFVGWYFFLKKSPEGEACKNTSKCQTGLKCLNKLCSSGKNGSSCETKTDCQTGFCVSNKCTEGKVNDACITYKDCSNKLLCQKGACVNPPDFSKYFDNIRISKIKPGSGPGPDNPLVPTTQFSTQDAIEVDFVGVKSETQGTYYFDIVDSTTGEIGHSTHGMSTKIDGQDTGSGTDLQMLIPGDYDVNVYFNDELIYTASIKIIQ